MAKEAAAAGLHWTFAPMVDITRDPRWGRVMEGAGEDPYLGSRIAEARVRGIQGKNFAGTDRLVACVKHFAGYGASEGGRDYNLVDMSERMFREVYMPPYKAAVKAGAKTVMTSFNEYDGIPASGSKYLLTDLLRSEWGFDGFVVSDYTSINEMVEHGVVKDETDAGILSLNAGMDMDMQGGIFQDKIKAGITDGRLSMAQVDNAVRRILRIKKELGLFENPYRFSDKNRESTVIMSKENLEASRDVARKSVVLLKNDGILPLSKTYKNILVAGPLGDDKLNMIGAWSASGEGRHAVSLYEGLRQHERSAGYNFDFIKGCEIEGSDKSMFEAVINKAKAADLVILAIGEHKDLSGEAASRAMIRIPGVQEDLLTALKATGKPIVTIVMNGRPLVLDEVDLNSGAVLEAWFLGTQAGNALADILYGTYNPSGKLPISFPRHEGQIPVYYSHRNTGRPFDPAIKWRTKYTDMSNYPLYPFGYGLSYATFDYSRPTTGTVSFKKGSPLLVSVSVTNTGLIDGEEVVQLYIRDLVSSVIRPIRELKAFKKVMIRKGETKKVEFTLSDEAFSFYNQKMRWDSEPGEFDIFVGGNSDTKNSIRVTMTPK